MEQFAMKTTIYSAIQQIPFYYTVITALPQIVVVQLLLQHLLQNVTGTNN